MLGVVVSILFGRSIWPTRSAGGGAGEHVAAFETARRCRRRRRIGRDALPPRLIVVMHVDTVTHHNGSGPVRRCPTIPCVNDAGAGSTPVWRAQVPLLSEVLDLEGVRRFGSITRSRGSRRGDCNGKRSPSCAAAPPDGQILSRRSIPRRCGLCAGRRRNSPGRCCMPRTCRCTRPRVGALSGASGGVHPPFPWWMPPTWLGPQPRYRVIPDGEHPDDSPG